MGTRLERSRKQYGRLVDDLHAAIVAGKMRPGAGLPSEHALSLRYGLGRNTVRRALSALAAEGLLETQAGRGSFVTAPADPATRAHTLQIAVYYPSAQTSRLGLIIQAFEEAHPLIRIQPLRLHPLGYVEAVTNLLEAGQGPDLVVFMNGMLPDLQPRTHFLDLGGFLGDRPQLARDLYPLACRLFQQAGRQYGLPFVLSPVVVAYDRRAFAEAELPEPDPDWTRDDLLDAAQRLTGRAPETGRVERYGLHLQMAVSRWPALVFAGGGALAAPDGSRGRLSAPESVAAIQFMVDLVHRHGVSGPFPGDLDGESLFVLRRAAMVVTSYYGADLHQFGTSGIDWDVTLLPAATVPGPASGGPGGRRHLFQSTAVGVNARTPRRQSALAFLDFICSPRIQQLIHLTGCSRPVRQSVAEATHQHDPRIHPPHVELYRRAIHENGDALPFYTSAAAMAAHRELLLAFGGMEDVATACRRADGRVATAARSRTGRAAAVAVPLASQDA